MVCVPNAGCFNRFEFPMVGKDRNSSAVHRNIFDVNVIHEDIHLPVTNQVSAQIIENLGFRLFIYFHAIGFDDFIHSRSNVGFRICIDFFDVGRKGANEDVEDFISVFLFSFGHRWLDDLVDDVERLLVTNDARKGVRWHDWVLVELVVLGALFGSLTLATTFVLFSCHTRTLCRSILSHAMADYNSWVKTTPKTVTCEQNIFSTVSVLTAEFIPRFQTQKATVHRRLETGQVQRCYQSNNLIQQ